MKFKPVWADSLGAKSFSFLVKTLDTTILIDPGVAIMHGSFPAPLDLKRKWVSEGYKEILKASEEAEIVIITHYHYDHFTDFEEKIYKGKIIIAKSPNEYINDSQRGRAIHFYRNLFNMDNIELEEVLEEPVEKEYPNPLEELKLATSIDYGDYWNRKKELLEKGYKWFLKRVSKWNSYKRIPEYCGKSFTLYFSDNQTFKFDKTIIKFTNPLFHGIEFSRVGWVTGFTIEAEGTKLLYSSDINGPIIEDYAKWIINEKPDIILLDGPATYTLGYMLNNINLKRAIQNIINIITEAKPKLLILDHHLLREPKYKTRLTKVYQTAEKLNIKTITVAEHLNKTPVVLTLANQQ